LTAIATTTFSLSVAELRGCYWKPTRRFGVFGADVAGIAAAVARLGPSAARELRRRQAVALTQAAKPPAPTSTFTGGTRDAIVLATMSSRVPPLCSGLRSRGSELQSAMEPQTHRLQVSRVQEAISRQACSLLWSAVWMNVGYVGLYGFPVARGHYSR
jgi:hypothetical protein